MRARYTGAVRGASAEGTRGLTGKAHAPPACGRGRELPTAFVSRGTPSRRFTPTDPRFAGEVYWRRASGVFFLSD